MKCAPQQHPFGLRYILLLLGAWILRLPVIIAAWRNKKKNTEKLVTAGVTRTRILIPSRESRRSIKVDVYERADQVKTGRQHVHLNVHGSGFIIPFLGSDIDFCADLASRGTVVFDTDYRKAPERPFPAGFEDVQDVFNYIQSKPDDFDVSHITISGFSAGGNLATALAVNSPPNSIAGLISFYINADITSVYAAPDVKNFDNGAIIPDWIRRFFYNCYILPGQDRADTRLSPAKAKSERWPEHVFMACGTADSLHVSAQLVVESLKKAGHGDAEFLSIEREAHGFDKNVKPGSVSEKRKNLMYGKAFDLIDKVHREA